MTLKWQLVEAGDHNEVLMTEPVGAFDGVLVSFGDGADDDTLNLVFHQAYVLRITPTNGDDFDVADGHMFTWNDNSQLVLRARHFDDQAGEAVGPWFDWPAEDIVAIHVY